MEKLMPIIRQIKEFDWAELRTIRLLALQSDPAVFGSNYAKESQMTESDWRGWLATNDSGIFLIDVDGKPLGMAGIAIDRTDPTKKRALLWGSWLAPAQRGKGYSHLFYEARITWAKNHPTCEKIIVSHRASNLASKHANQKHSFVWTHNKQKTWPDGTTEDECCYELVLT
jgi:RimJ/RimL family protein N-acetyltransferase